jgi:aryl-alcohol dehydrogenase-like predicted oxidoreductase
MTPQLCLGTAQFGLAYGITNAAGQVTESEVAQLLHQAANGGIHWLDTAQAYGNAEAVLGRHMPVGHSFQLISKLPAQPQQSFTAADQTLWEQAFDASCQRLALTRLDALLLHAPSDLSKPGGEWLQEWLIGLRDRGLVQRLGVSIYGASDLDGVDPALLDLVQVPLSLYDQRLLHDGTLTRLRARGTAVHARSLYLQGLLLTPAERWPSWVGPEVRRHHQRLEALALERGRPLIELALGFAQLQADLEAVVLGLCSCQELAELQQAWAAIPPWQQGEWHAWALQDPGILDPRNWPR